MSRDNGKPSFSSIHDFMLNQEHEEKDREDLTDRPRETGRYLGSDEGCVENTVHVVLCERLEGTLARSKRVTLKKELSARSPRRVTQCEWEPSGPLVSGLSTRPGCAPMALI